MVIAAHRCASLFKIEHTGPHKHTSLPIGGKRNTRSIYASPPSPTSAPTYHSVPMNGHCCTPVRKPVQDRTHRSTQTHIIVDWGEKVHTLYICFPLLAHISPNLPQRAHEWSLLHTGAQACSRSNTQVHTNTHHCRLGGKGAHALYTLPPPRPHQPQPTISCP